MNIEDKIDLVKNILKDKKVALGFSGGADSTLMAYLSSKVAEDTLAITIDNHLMPSNFIENTKQATESLGITHEIIDINFYDDDQFMTNDSSRCYSCRNLMYTEIERIAKKRGFDFLCDGNNISDLVIDRPGILITYQKGFNTPFIEAKLTSKEIHEYLDKNDIAYSRSTTCLATRIATDTQTTYEKIERISNCEDYISSNADCEIVKVRDFGEYGIIEVDNINELLDKDKFKQINDELKRQGFEKVALNLLEIDDNEYINIDFDEGSFSYRLPFTINLENTKNQLESVHYASDEKIEIENFIIFEDGLIKGNNFKNYEHALDAFMELLPKLRRNIR